MSLSNLALLVSAAVSLALGLFVFFQGRERPANITLALLSAAMSFWCFGQFVGDNVTAKLAVLWWTRANLAGAIFIPIFYFHFILVFCRRVQRDLSWLRLGYLIALGLLLLDLTPWFVADVVPRLGYRYYPRPGVIYPFFALYLVSFFTLSLGKLIGYIKQSSAPENNQAKYILAASLIGFIGGATAFFPVFNLKWPVVSHYALPLYLAITVYVIVKHQLLDLKVVIRQGLVYSSLTALFAGAYIVLILTADHLFRSVTRSNELMVMAIVVFVSLLFFQPLKDRIQKIFDRLFSRGEYRYQQTIDDLSTENKQLFTRLLQADKLAALGTLSAGMAHEIKNPLASLKGLTQILRENLDDPDFLIQYQTIVGRQIDRINTIVENLLKYGQPGKLAVNEFDFNRVINEVLALFASQCRKQDIVVAPKLLAPALIYGDAEQITQVLTNLILNAIQAMPKGGMLGLGMREKNEGIMIEISDTGKGIPAERLAQIFDPFYTTKEEGSGMGLAVTYRIIKEHGGEIEVSSQPSQGTTFTVWLPTKPERSV